jgi:hypothetical protein
MKRDSLNSTTPVTLDCSSIQLRESVVKGVSTRIRCVEIGGQIYSLSDGPIRTVSLEDDWYEDVGNPAAIIEALQGSTGPAADIFTFWQRPPDVEPVHDYYREFDELAVLPLSTYEDWWSETIKSRLRTTIRKSEKLGVEVREADYDDDFIEGMQGIFNEERIRQGRPFWHFGKDFDTIKQQFSRFVHRERMIGAYYEGEMIGFVMLGDAGRFSLLGQILSSIHHRDKAPNNALIAKSVELAAQQGHEQLVYWYWSEDSLSEFKRRCGFQRIQAPRYYVPLTQKGRIALRVGAHRGLRNMIPPTVKHRLKELRNRWYSARNQ